MPKSLLWVGKAPLHGAAAGGDEIYDRKSTGILARSSPITFLHISKQTHRAQATGLIRGLPHPRFKYFSREVVDRFQLAIESHDRTVISWESFDYLALTTTRPVTLILHNVMSDALIQIFPNNPIAAIASQHSLHWERRIYRRPNVKLIVLSQRDRELIGAIAPDADISIASPGAPPAASLANKRFIPEVVISGSYDWLPKRRDLLKIANQVAVLERPADHYSTAFRYDQPLPASVSNTPLAAIASRIRSDEYSNALRIGLIPDTFLGGFKLKATFYVAMNCIIASFVDIRSEFDGLPHSNEFVHYITSMEQLSELARSMNDLQDAAMFVRWQKFRSACINRFSWENTAQTIGAWPSPK